MWGSFGHPDEVHLGMVKMLLDQQEPAIARYAAAGKCDLKALSDLYYQQGRLSVASQSLTVPLSTSNPALWNRVLDQDRRVRALLASCGATPVATTALPINTVASLTSEAKKRIAALGAGSVALIVAGLLLL